MSRHYAVLINYNTYHPSVTTKLTRTASALMKDPACIVVINEAQALAVAALGMPIVEMEYDYMENCLLFWRSAERDGRIMAMTSPVPWTLNTSHAIAGARSMLNDDERKGLTE